MTPLAPPWVERVGTSGAPTVSAFGTPTAGAVEGAWPGDGAGPLPPMMPPTFPKGEWMGQNQVGSVPGMNDSM